MGPNCREGNSAKEVGSTPEAKRELFAQIHARSETLGLVGSGNSAAGDCAAQRAACYARFGPSVATTCAANGKFVVKHSGLQAN